jgi:hypothetical protein
VVIVLLVVGGVAIWKNNSREPEKGEVETSKVAEKKKSETEKAEAAKPEESVADKAIEEKKVPQYEGDDPNMAEELTGAITYAGVVGDKLMIRVNIDQFLTSGECKLGLRRGGANIYNLSARIVDNVSTSTCEGFDVPISELGAGNVQIVITVQSGEKTGTIEGEVTI